MKRLIFAFLSLILLAIIAVYISVPGEINISKGIIAKANAIGSGRALSDQVIWRKLWPAEKTQNSKEQESLSLNGFSYQIKKKNYNSYEVSIPEESRYESSIFLALLNTDSVGIEWRGKIFTGNNPISKLKAYFNAKKIRRNLDDILYAMKVFLEDNRNVYGLKITPNKITDSVMVSMIKVFNTKPGTAEIYTMVNPLKDYAGTKGAKQTNYPMMGNLPADSNHFKVITAIPINKTIPEQKEFVIKRMLFDGNNLAAEIRGGPTAIRNGYAQMNLYISDYQRTLAVAPFEFLVTDRMKEPDTSKWVTILNYPVY